MLRLPASDAIPSTHASSVASSSAAKSLRRANGTAKRAWAGAAVWRRWGARLSCGATHIVCAPVWTEKQRCGGWATALPSARSVGDSWPTVMSVMSSRRRLADNCTARGRWAVEWGLRRRGWRGG
eukprot:5140779-Prymnesium_polylepis.3